MRHHMYLACLKLTFVDAEGGTGVTETNTMIKANKQQVGLELLARAQQGAQIQLIEKLNDPNIQVLDAVFTGMFYLGHMTQAEFDKRTPQTVAPAATSEGDAFDVKTESAGETLGIQDN